MALADSADLAAGATITATSELKLAGFMPSGETMPLNASWGMMLPVQPGPMPTVEYVLDVTGATTLRAELRVSSKPENHTPDVILASKNITLTPGRGVKLPLAFAATIDVPRYAFVCLLENPDVEVHLSDQRVTGVLAVTQKYNRAVAKSPLM